MQDKEIGRERRNRGRKREGGIREREGWNGMLVFKHNRTKVFPPLQKDYTRTNSNNRTLHLEKKRENFKRKEKKAGNLLF